MLFPIIKVRDKYSGRTHIVGTDQHDVLTVGTRGINYYNLQCGDGTGDGFEFVGEDGGHLGTVVKFVDFEELRRINDTHMKAKAELDKRLKKMYGEGVRVIS